MPDQTGHFRWVIVASRIAFGFALLLIAVTLVIAVANLALAIHQGAGADILPLAIWVLAVLAAAAALPVLYGLAVAIARGAGTSIQMSGQLGRIETLIEDSADSVRKLAELSTLSDEARSLLYRDKEIEAMREAVHAMLVRQDYVAAEAFIASLEHRPAYASEAAAMRQELTSTRQASLEGKIDLAVQRVEEIMARNDWARALREAQRMMQALPGNQKIAALPQRIEAARAKHKRDLLQSYGEAVRKNDIDGSIAVLKELDRYLSPQEAAALQDSARGVFRAKLHNMGVQFAIRITERNWKEAIAVGEDIIRSYPNSRMAHEVQAKMDILRQQAGTTS